jgi:putative FmdB family regulatory protein
MPLFCFQCEDCLKEYEVQMTVKELEEEQVKCPHCEQQMKLIIKPVYFKIN